MDSSKYLNQSILRSLQILETFAVPNPVFSIPEISRHVGLHRSTVHRLVVTLETAGWLRKLPNTEKYTLGIKVSTLGSIANAGISSKEVVRPLLEDLARKTGETVILSMSNNLESLCIDKVESSQAIKISSNIGQNFPLHAGATGFAVLLGMPTELVEKVLFSKPLTAYTEKTIVEPNALLDLYKQHKQNGYIVTCGIVDAGVTAIAAPIFFMKENAYGSVGIVLPENRATAENIELLIKMVLETKKAINKKIGI